MFSIFFFHLFRRKSFFFSCISCISFKYVLLLALVSEFYCFLRSRCSMEMWCPDDVGRDSWDWVGLPAWGSFNSPEWGGSSSPVKTEPPQIVLLLLLLWLCVVVVVCCCVLLLLCVVVVVVVVVVFVSALCACKTTSHAHATESKANYYSLNAKPGDVANATSNYPTPTL